jgi:hypothetical protein
MMYQDEIKHLDCELSKLILKREEKFIIRPRRETFHVPNLFSYGKSTHYCMTVR